MNWLRTFRKQYVWEGIGVLVLSWVLWVNMFPAGHIILGADILQPINMAERLSTFHTDWSGRVSLYYSLFYVLDWLGVSDTAQISWYIGIFLFGAYFSFLSFGTLLFPTLSRWVRVLVALFYALNPFTLYLFTATWGYSHYPILYIFIPLLTALYIRFLTARTGYSMLLLFGFATFLASGSFGNPAFALALGLYFFLLTLLLLILQIIKWERAMYGRLCVGIVGALLLNAYWILPLLPQLRSGIEGVYTSEFVDLGERLRKTSNAPYDTLRLLPTSEQNRYYPSNFPYVSLSFLKPVVAAFTFAPFFLTLLGWFLIRGHGPLRRYFILFSALLLLFVVLVARVRYPFDVWNTFFFQLPGLNTLRGWDKMALLVPFIMSVPLLLSLGALKGKSYQYPVLGFFLGVVVCVGLPFFGGGLQTKLSYILSGQKAKNFELSKQSALVQIPSSYEEIAPVLDADKSEHKLAMLPYSPGSSVGRVNLSAWKVNGPHPAHALYRQPFLEAYDSYLPGWQFGADFESTADPRWISHLLGLLGVKYVLYQKDAKPERLEDFRESLDYLQQTGELELVTDSEWVTLYRLRAERLFPLVYKTGTVPLLLLTPEEVTEGVEALHSGVAALPFARQNSQYVTVPVTALSPGETLFLTERFDPLWRAEYTNPNGQMVVLKRDPAVHYANAWKIENDVQGGEVTFIYTPLRYLTLGEYLTGLMLLLLSLGVLWQWRSSRMKQLT